MSEPAKHGATPELPPVDVTERAGHHTGNPQELHSRLFMQLMVFECDEQLVPEATAAALASGLRERGAHAVVYRDVNAPRGLGVLSFSEAPEDFVTRTAPALTQLGPGLRQRHELTMLGRSYATGYEDDLAYWLLRRPVETVLNPAWPWAVWYPLRRGGAFEKLEGREKGAVLKEHGLIGRAYGAQDLAHDVRLACHGLDASDNEFVIGLIGKELHPLSHVVQRMRSTRQTSEFISQMGPFFVGHVWHRVG